MANLALPLIPGQGLQGIYPIYDPNYEILASEGAVTTYPDGVGGLTLPPVTRYSGLSVQKVNSGANYQTGDDLTLTGLAGANGTGTALAIHVSFANSISGSIGNYYVSNAGLYSVQPTDQANDPVPVVSGTYSVLGGHGAGAQFLVTWNAGGSQQGVPLGFSFQPSPELLNRKLYAFIYAQQAGGTTGNLGLSIDLYRPNIGIPQKYPLIFQSTVMPNQTIPSFFTGKGSVYSIAVSMQYSLATNADPSENNISPFLLTSPIDKILMRFDYANGWVGDPALPCFFHYYFGIISSH